MSSPKVLFDSIFLSSTAGTIFPSRYSWNERNTGSLFPPGNSSALSIGSIGSLGRKMGGKKGFRRRCLNRDCPTLERLEQNRFYELTRYVGAIFAVSFDRQAS